MARQMVCDVLAMARTGALIVIVAGFAAEPQKDDFRQVVTQMLDYVRTTK